jgi:hypothetical protein
MKIPENICSPALVSRSIIEPCGLAKLKEELEEAAQ